MEASGAGNSFGRPPIVPLAPGSYQVGSKRPYNPGAADLTFTGATHGDDDGDNEVERWEAEIRSSDPNISKEKLRRMISNRISARKNRNKKWAHFNELQEQEKMLEAQINGELKPQLEMLTRDIKILEIENKSMMFKIDAYEKQEIARNAEIEANRTEVRKLREVQLQLIQMGAVILDPEQQARINREMMRQYEEDSELISLFFGQTTVNNGDNDIAATINPNSQQGPNEEMSGMMVTLDDPTVNLAGPGDNELGLQNEQSGVDQNDAAGPSDEVLDLEEFDIDVDTNADEIERLLNQSPPRDYNSIL